MTYRVILDLQLLSSHEFYHSYAKCLHLRKKHLTVKVLSLYWGCILLFANFVSHLGQQIPAYVDQRPVGPKLRIDSLI